MDCGLSRTAITPKDCHRIISCITRITTNDTAAVIRSSRKKKVEVRTLGRGRIEFPVRINFETAGGRYITTASVLFAVLYHYQYISTVSNFVLMFRWNRGAKVLSNCLSIVVETKTTSIIVYAVPAGFCSFLDLYHQRIFLLLLRTSDEEAIINRL